LTDSIPDDHPLRGIHASPIPERPPEVWLLGSSDQSAALAVHFGRAFSFAQFISPGGGSWVTNAYREPSNHRRRSRSPSAVSAYS